jgi:CspA family cold shock protein
MRWRRPASWSQAPAFPLADGLTVTIGHAHFSSAIRALGLHTSRPRKLRQMSFVGTEGGASQTSVIVRGLASPVWGRAFLEGLLSRRIESDMANGTVKWFNSAKGFGFIQPDDGGKDVFVHISAVERAGLRGLNEGQKVAYELQAERGRTAAVNLQAL